MQLTIVTLNDLDLERPLLAILYDGYECVKYFTRAGTNHDVITVVSSLLHYVNLILFTILVHLILHISPYHSHHLHSHHLSLPLPFTPDFHKSFPP